MRELINNPFYEQIKAYKGCITDYCLIEDDIPYQGYRSHKDKLRISLNCEGIKSFILIITLSRMKKM